MMMPTGRNVALYFESMAFQPGTLTRLADAFDVITRANPDDLEGVPCDQVRVLFAPMGYRFDAERLARFPQLAAIGSPTTGVPHIDETVTSSRGIAVCSLRHEQAYLRTITPTAELAWGLLLGVLWRLPFAHRVALNGPWPEAPDVTGLSGRSLGVVGLGRLGSLVARYGAAFGMTVRYVDPLIADARFERCESLAALAACSDVVSLHVHSTPDTRGMIDRAFLGLLPRGAIFINTSRGDLVDETALLEALQRGHLAGAGLDTLDGEHLPGFAERAASHPIVAYARTHPEVVLTPHCGGSTCDAWERTEQRIVDLVIAALATRPSAESVGDRS